MQDSPNAQTILAEVQIALKAGIAPGFQQAVASNAVALALREGAMAEAGHAAERTRLNALLDREGDLAELNRTLSEAIAAGTADGATLEHHLIRTTIEKIMVDQPNYPAFRLWRASLGDPK